MLGDVFLHRRKVVKLLLMISRRLQPVHAHFVKSVLLEESRDKLFFILGHNVVSPDLRTPEGLGVCT